MKKIISVIIGSIFVFSLLGFSPVAHAVTVQELQSQIVQLSNEISAINNGTSSSTANIADLQGQIATLQMLIASLQGGGSATGTINSVVSPVVKVTRTQISLSKGQLVSNFNVTVKSVGGTTYIPQYGSFVTLFYNSSKQSSAWANSCTRQISPIGSVNTDGKYYIVDASSTASFSIKSSCPIDELFAGSYQGTLESLYYKSASGTHDIYFKNFSTLSKYIVGEKGPYVKNVICKEFNCTASGERLNKVVSFDYFCGIAGNKKVIKSTGRTVTFAIPKSDFEGKGCSLQFVDSNGVKSNHVYVSIDEAVNPTTTPMVLITAPNGGESYHMYPDKKPLLEAKWKTTSVPKDYQFGTMRLRRVDDSKEYPLSPKSYFNDGLEYIDIPDSVGSGTYYFEIKGYLGEKLLIDRSDSYFKIYRYISPTTTAVGNIVVQPTKSGYPSSLLVSTSGETEVGLAEYDFKSENLPSIISGLRFGLSTKSDAGAITKVFKRLFLTVDGVVYSADAISMTPTFSNMKIMLPAGEWKTVKLSGIVADADEFPLPYDISTFIGVNSENIQGVDANRNAVTANAGGYVSSPVMFLSISSASVGNMSSSYNLINNGPNPASTAAVSFRFTLSNNSSTNIYVSKDPSIFVAASTTAVRGSLTDIQPIAPISADTASAYVIPSNGAKRDFVLVGTMSNDGGSSGYARFNINKIFFGDSATTLQKMSINSGLEALNVSTFLNGTVVPPVPVETSVVTPSVIPNTTSIEPVASGAVNCSVVKDYAKNIYKQDSFVSSTGLVTKAADHCVGDKTLVEYYCTAGLIRSSVTSCATGCSVGACKQPVASAELLSQMANVLAALKALLK